MEFPRAKICTAVLFMLFVWKGAEARTPSPPPVIKACVTFDAGSETLSKKGDAALVNTLSLMKRVAPLYSNSISVEVLTPVASETTLNYDPSNDYDPSQRMIELGIARLHQIQARITPAIIRTVPRYLSFLMSSHSTHIPPEAKADCQAIVYVNVSGMPDGLCKYPLASCVVTCDANGCEER